MSAMGGKRTFADTSNCAYLPPSRRDTPNLGAGRIGGGEPHRVQENVTMSMWLMDKRLRRLIKTGDLTVTTASGRVYRYGQAQPGRPSVAVRLADRRVPYEIIYDPALGAGEAFMDERLILE